VNYLKGKPYLLKIVRELYNVLDSIPKRIKNISDRRIYKRKISFRHKKY